jgi:hypothetical protein
MLNTPVDVTSEWDTIRSYLPKDYRELADEYKQVQTQFGNAKIQTADDLLRLVLLHVGANLPLRQTVAIMKAAGGPDVSHVRLHKKMLRAAPYFRALVRKMVDATPADSERWAGYEVVTVDATAVCSPGAETTDARVHVQMRVTDLDFVTVRVEDVSVGETFKLFPWQPSQLAVGDRAYCNPPGIRAVVADGADVLVRLNRGALPLCKPTGERFDLMSWLRGLRSHDAADVDVVISDKKGALTDVCGRVVAIRLPVAQAEKARARLAREHGSKVSELDREVASYVVLFTTVPRSRLNAELCLELYRLRWQVELLFKRWKSLCGLDRLPNYLDETITAWLYAKVLLALLMQRMGASAISPPEPALSPPRRRAASSMGPAAMEAGLDPLADHRLRAPALRSA